MYRLTIFIDDPNIEPIEIETETPRIETQGIIQHGCEDTKTGITWMPHMIRKIKREEINEQPPI